jgi:hypothetical protein
MLSNGNNLELVHDLTVPFLTNPITPPPPAPVPPPPAPAVRFPLGFLLEKASAPIQYRAIREVAELDANDIRGLESLPLTFSPAVLLSLLQSPDGTWNNAMLTVPGARSEDFRGVGTVQAVLRLLEYGWDRESPPLARARRILFRLLAEDEDPSYLFEFGAKGKVEPEQVDHSRQLLREAAAAALAHAGYESDPRLRGAANRILDRINNYLTSALSKKPWVRSGNRQVLPPEAHPPSIHVLLMLARMPHFRSEHHAVVDRIYHHITQPLPRQESAQLVGRKILSQPQYVLGDMLPHRNALDADVPWALMWLEMMARLGFLKRNENWLKLFDRFVDDMDSTGVWHPHKGLAAPRSTNPFVWPFFPLEASVAGEERWTDVTFRLGLIARLIGRPIELI